MRHEVIKKLLKEIAVINLTTEFDLSNVGGNVDDKRMCSAVFLEPELTPTHTRTRDANKLQLKADLAKNI